MEEKVKNTTAEDVATSVGSIYAKLAARRKLDKEKKQEKKEEEK